MFNMFNMFNMKQIKAGILGVIFTIIGILLRFYAKDISWPNEYSYSGPRENTIWAIRESAYQDIGLVFLMFGFAVILIIINNWLWNPSVQEDNRNTSNSNITHQ